MSEDELSVHISKISKATDGEYMQELDEYIKSLDPGKLIELSCNTIMQKTDVPIVAFRISFILINRNKKFLISNWKDFSIPNRDFIKDTLMTGILSGDIPSRNCASNIYAFIVEADKIFGIQLHILELISQYVINPEISDQSKLGSIFALKEMLQSNVLSPELDFYIRSFQVFTQYLIYILTNPYQFEDDFFSIIECYNHILPFYKNPLNDSEYSEYKEQVITLIQNIIDNEARSNYCDCLYYFLFIVFRTCYSSIIANMEQIFQITIISFSKEKEDLVIPSIRFWKEVADFENQLIIEDNAKQKQSKESDISINNIISTVSQELIQPIVEFMINFSNDDLPDEDTDTIPCIEASDTLLSFGRLTSNIFEFVKNNFDEMVASSEKKIRYVAIVLLRCITSGPNKKEQVTFIASHFNQILSMIEDPSLLIKDAVLSSIDEIIRIYKPIATNEVFFDALGQVLIDSPFQILPLAIRACDIVNTIGVNFEEIKDKCPIFEKAFPDIINIMRKMLEREDAPLSKLGSHCTMALVSVINSTPTCHENIIVDLLNSVNEQIRSEVTKGDIVPTEYIQTIIQYLCIVIYSIVKRLGANVDPYSEPIIETLLVLLTKKSVICHEDGLFALSALVKVLKEKIKQYVPRIIEIFIISQESKMEEIVKMSAYLIFCLFQSIGQFMSSEEEFNQTIIRTFNENLNDDNIFITSKIEILNAMSEMVKFLNFSILSDFESQLKQFQSFLFTNQENLDIETTCHLCAAILNGYQSLIIATIETDYTQNIISNYKEITKLFMRISLFKSSMTKGLMNAILSYLYELLSNTKYKMFVRSVNEYLHKKCVTSILEYISNIDDDMDISFKASRILKLIEHC